ncbi:MAG TPA: tetratricopeptide repeat protein [Blastocatellia bacterium]|nr:tetratricopeptide repeat protein [Blastocatellia bacterium]
MSFNKSKALQTASKLVQQGRLRAALDEYREILRNDPHDIATMNVFGDLCAKAGQTAEAVNVFVRIADRYLKQDSIPKAVAMLRKAVKLAPDNTDAGIRLAALYFKQNLLVEAQQQYLTVADQLLRQGRRDEAFSFYENLIKSDPGNLALQLRVAEAYLRVQNTDRACELFIAAADQLQEQLKHEEALKAYLQALKARPDDRRPLTAAINIYLRRAETRPAETLLRHLLRNSPDDPALLNLLARVHQVGHDLEIARQAISGTDEPVSEYLQHQVELVSACGRAYATFFTAAGELERQGQYEEALQNYLKALRIKPESRPATIAAVNIYLHRNEPQTALKLIRHLLQMLPEDAELLSLLGRVYCEVQDFEAALQAIGRTVTLDATRFQELLSLASHLARRGDCELTLRALDYVGDTLRERNEEQQAVPILRQLLTRDPQQLGVLERLAGIYLRAGERSRLGETLRSLFQAAIHHARRDLAIEALQQLVKLEPEAAWPRQQLRELGCEIEEVPLPEPPLAATADLPLPTERDFPSSMVMLLDESEPQPATQPVSSDLLQDQPVSDPVTIQAEEAEQPVAYFPDYNRFEPPAETVMIAASREEAQPEKRLEVLEPQPESLSAEAAETTPPEVVVSALSAESGDSTAETVCQPLPALTAAEAQTFPEAEEKTDSPLLADEPGNLMTEEPEAAAQVITEISAPADATESAAEPEADIPATSPATFPPAVYQVVLVNFDMRPQFPTHWRWPGRTTADRRKEPARPVRRSSGRSRKGWRPGRS